MAMVRAGQEKLRARTSRTGTTGTAGVGSISQAGFWSPPLFGAAPAPEIFFQERAGAGYVFGSRGHYVFLLSELLKKCLKQLLTRYT